MNQTSYDMSNNCNLFFSNECFTQVAEPFVDHQTEINEKGPFEQPVQTIVTPEQEFSLFNPMYEGCLNAADDQHTSSLVLDYLTTYNEESNQSEIRSNPEAEKIFTQIAFVQRIIEKEHVQAYKELPPNHLLVKAGNMYRVVDKRLNQLLKLVIEQGCKPLEKYDCEHSKIVVQAFDEILSQFDHGDFHAFFDFPYELLTVKSLDGTQFTIRRAELLNQFVERVYQLTQEKEFKYQQKKRMDRSRYQLKVATECVDAILVENSRIVIARVDFRYGKTQDPSLEQVKKDLRTCLRFIKRTKNLHVLGHTWKLEFAENTGYHYHCFFFLDGRHHSQDIKLAQQIGEIWKKVVGIEGAYHNCNLDAHNGKYKEVGIGTLQRNDLEKYRILIDVIRYITKRDQFIVHKQFLEDVEKERKIIKKAYFTRVFGTSIDKKVAKLMGRPAKNAKQGGA